MGEGGEPSPLAAALEALARARSFTHPWEGLESHTFDSGAQMVKLVGYGSLVNAASAAVTLRESAAPPRPVVAHGARRVFNYRMSEQSRYRVTAESRDRALLNVDWTRDPADTISGVLLEVAFSDLPALRLREADYDLVPVVCVDWDSANPIPEPAYVLCCDEQSGLGRVRVDRSLMPNRDYYRLCRDGAESFGSAFLRHWLDSTFLADGITRVGEWEQSWWSG